MTGSGDKKLPRTIQQVAQGGSVYCHGVTFTGIAVQGVASALERTA